MLCRSITPSPAEHAVLRAAIIDDEARRLERFVRVADANRFLVGRGTLRIEVGRMLDVAPRDVTIELGPQGKPLIAGGLPHVNVSHAGDVVLVALTRDAAIGIDVERIEERFVEPGVMDVSFSRREIADVAALPEAMRVAAFFHVWATREAVIKAVGAGFSMPREAFDVSVDPRLPPAVVATREALPSFCIVPIAVPAGHVAMLAACDVSACDVSLVSDPQYSES